MKKTLLVLALAMCGTMVFAQKASPKKNVYQAPAKVAQAHHDYTGSIFTKDGIELL